MEEVKNKKRTNQNNNTKKKTTSNKAIKKEISDVKKNSNQKNKKNIYKKIEKEKTNLNSKKVKNNSIITSNKKERKIKTTNQIVKEIKGPDLKKLEYDIKKDINRKNKKKTIKNLILIVVLVILILVFVGLHLIIPCIKLNGNDIVEINYNEVYIEYGANASFLNEDLTSKIKITNNVDNTKVGTYYVTYEIKTGNYNLKKERIVKVVDKKIPVITLEGEQEYNVCPNKEFKEIGFTALDEYDGDITNKVAVDKKKNEIIYSVKDSSNNSFTITRKINYVDKEKPVITLKGNNTMYLNVNEKFREPGYTASDNCDGDITNKVVSTGSVDISKIGTYTISYKVTDTNGNTTTVQRKIVVSNKTDPNSGVVKKGAIYLTFDDGPSAITTLSILDILKEENVKATFFVTNNGPDYLIKRMYDDGHTVALHTASHDYSKIYSSVDNYFADLKKVSDRVKRITGQTSKIVRFPGGSSNTISRRYSSGIMTTLSNELFSRGYRYYDWNIDSGDASTSKTKEAVYNRVVNNLSKNRANIVLMHDIKSPTRDAIRDIIRYGKQNGYTFEKIDMDTYMVRQKINN